MRENSNSITSSIDNEEKKVFLPLFIYLVESNWPYERRHKRGPSVVAEKVFGVSIVVMEANLSNWQFRS
jgi:hypothetical protein